MDLKLRDTLLNAAVEYTQYLTGKKRDVAVFDYLCGACKALHEAALEPSDCPAWLWIIGVRAGNRLKEIERMLHAE